MLILPDAFAVLQALSLSACRYGSDCFALQYFLHVCLNENWQSTFFFRLVGFIDTAENKNHARAHGTFFLKYHAPLRDLCCS